MSKARSPREVCSITIGIRGMSSLLAAGGPELLRLRRLLLFLAGGPDRRARRGLLLADRLHLGGDAVEGLPEAEVGADAVGAAGGEELVDVLVGLALLAQRGPDLLVGHLEAEPVGDRLEDELAGDRLLRLVAQLPLELRRGPPGRGEERARVDPAALERAHEPGEELLRAHLDREPLGVDVRGPHERVERELPELQLGRPLALLADARLDVAAELGERLELGDGLREVVVRGRQHLLVQLLQRHRPGLAGAVRELPGDLAALSREHAPHRLLDLVDEALRAELEHVVALAVAGGRDDVDDGDVAGLGGPRVDRREVAGRALQGLDLRRHRLLADLDPGARDLARRPVGELGPGLDGELGGEAPVLVGARRQLVGVLGRAGRPHARARDGAPEPIADVRVDGLAVHAPAADLRDEHLRRHLALAEARHLHVRGQVARRVLDRVVDVVGRSEEQTSELQSRELLPLSFHPAILPKWTSVAAWTPRPRSGRAEATSGSGPSPCRDRWSRSSSGSRGGRRTTT